MRMIVRVRHVIFASLAALLVACAPLGREPSGMPAGEAVSLRVLAFNDFHGHLRPGEAGTVAVPDPAAPGGVRRVEAGGAAALAALIAERRAGRDHVLVLSGGDLIGASPLTSALFHDEPTIEVMNRIGVDANVVGNHEFDRGRAELMRLMAGGCAPPAADGVRASCAAPTASYAGARFPFLAANVRDADGLAILPASIVRRVGTVRVAVIGAVTRTTPTIVAPAGIVGLRFEDEAEAINREVRSLRAQGIETFIAVIHEGGRAAARTGAGGECVQASGPIFDIVDRLDRAVDLVLSGHTHQSYLCRRNGVPVAQSGAYGRLLAEIDLRLDPATGDVVPGSLTMSNLPVLHDPARVDAAVAAIVERYASLARPRAEREVGRLREAVGTQPSAGGDSPAGRLIADAHLAATRGKAVGAAQIAFMNPGGIRAGLAMRAPEGAVSYGDAFAMQPFGNSLVTMTLTGAQIATLLEQQWTGVNRDRPRILQPSAGFGYVWDANAPAGARVVPGTMRLDGRLIEPQAVYRVTVNSFLADGGDGFTVFTEGEGRVGGPQDLDALTTWLRARSPLTPDAVPRIERRGRPAL
jgi:5'-nucleotidase